MKRIVELHLFFFRESPKYMEGYSLLTYCLGLPRAYFRFMRFSLRSN